MKNEELKKGNVQEESTKKELTEKELEEVSGGRFVARPQRNK